MKRLQPFTFAVCLATLGASASLGVAIAADSAVATQDLQNVLASDQVKFARWTRHPDAYVLLVGLDGGQGSSRSSRTTADPAAVTPAEPAPRFTLPPPVGPSEVAPPDRGSFFIGNTIANLRGLDPAFCGRTLTLVNGRRTVSGQPQAVRPPQQSGPTDQPYGAAVREPRVEVWLLKADGTQILPITYKCDPGLAGAVRTDRVFEISYAYPAAEGALAVAAAIRVGDDFFIEKLQPLQPPAMVQ